jgi:ABC-type uncharacterized transport system ATPase subunit
MEGSTVIEIASLSKRYGEKLAVDGLDFVVRPGIVTGFLGPNGSGKSVTGLRHSLPLPSMDQQRSRQAVAAATTR